MAKIGLPKGSGKQLKVREKSVKSQGVLKWILSGNPALVARYYVIPFGVCPSVRPSVRPCSPFPIDNLSIYSRNFFKFCIHIVIGDEWYGIVNWQNPSIFNGVTALFRIGKMVSGLLFLYYS